MKITKTENKLLTAAVYAHTYATAKFVGEYNIMGVAHFNGKRELSAAEKLVAKGLIAIVDRNESTFHKSCWGSFAIADSRAVHDIMGGQFYKDMWERVVKNLGNNHPTYVRYMRELKYAESKSEKETA